MNFGLLLAAGKGNRFGAEKPKQFISLAGRPLLTYSLEVFENSPLVDAYGILCPENWHSETRKLREDFGGDKCRFIKPGGSSRRLSVKRGLEEVEELAANQVELATVHDTARPVITTDFLKTIISRAKTTAGGTEGVVPGLKLRDTVKKLESARSEKVDRTLSRDCLRRIQTPQVFEFESLLRVHREWKADREPTDDAMMLERAGLSVEVVSGLEVNQKLTFPRDRRLLAFNLERVEENK